MTDTETFELTMSRYFAASPAEVYRAFVNPADLAQWFAPLVFHVPIGSIDIDARAGGHWKMTPISSTFEEVIENELLVGYEIVQGFPGMEDGAKLSMRLEFHAEGEGTRLELRQGPFPEIMREMSAVGWGQSFYKLDGLLATPAKWRLAPA
jgi:uncharacterized protein YndB with AHSA1/START domain